MPPDVDSWTDDDMRHAFTRGIREERARTRRLLAPVIAEIEGVGTIGDVTFVRLGDWAARLKGVSR